MKFAVFLHGEKYPQFCVEGGDWFEACRVVSDELKARGTVRRERDDFIVPSRSGGGINLDQVLVVRLREPQRAP